jgi:hypothetical protein
MGIIRGKPSSVGQISEQGHQKSIKMLSRTPRSARTPLDEVFVIAETGRAWIMRVKE